MTAFAASTHDMVSTYDRLSRSYDTLHRRWLRYAGGEAQSALEATVRASMTVRTTLLDAGCGTGAFARRLLAEGARADQLSLLDPSRGMLRRCDDIPCIKVHGRLEALPFADDAFDILTCAWALETVPNVRLAVQEMCRVLRPGGILALAFCAQRPCRGALDRMMTASLERRGTGRFLRVDDVADAIRLNGEITVRLVPLVGPVAMLVARKAALPSALGAVAHVQRMTVETTS